MTSSPTFGPAVGKVKRLHYLASDDIAHSRVALRPPNKTAVTIDYIFLSGAKVIIQIVRKHALNVRETIIVLCTD